MVVVCFSFRSSMSRSAWPMWGMYISMKLRFLYSLSSFLLAPQPPMPPLEIDEEDRRALAVHLLATYPD